MSITVCLVSIHFSPDSYVALIHNTRCDKYTDFSGYHLWQAHPLLLATADHLTVLGLIRHQGPILCFLFWYWVTQLIAPRMGHMCILVLWRGPHFRPQ